MNTGAGTDAVAPAAIPMNNNAAETTITDRHGLNDMRG
jgi:hypothetical protein